MPYRQDGSEVPDFATPQADLYTEIQQKRNDLNKCIRLLRETGTALAEAEREYRVMLRAETLALRDEGLPATLIRDVVRGVDDVANLRFERDKALVIYEANKDAVNAVKLELRLLDAQLQREYGTPQAGY